MKAKETILSKRNIHYYSITFHIRKEDGGEPIKFQTSKRNEIIKMQYN
jgi:hypothetical protein